MLVNFSNDTLMCAMLKYGSIENFKDKTQKKKKEKKNEDFTKSLHIVTIIQINLQSQKKMINLYRAEFRTCKI